MYFNGPITSSHTVNSYSPTSVSQTKNMTADSSSEHLVDTFSSNKPLPKTELRFGFWRELVGYSSSSSRRHNTHHPTRSRVEDRERQSREIRPLSVDQWRNVYSANTVRRVRSFTEQHPTDNYYRWKHKVYDTYNPQGVWMSRRCENGSWRHNR